MLSLLVNKFGLKSNHYDLKALLFFGCSEFALLIGMHMPEFLQSYLIIREEAPDCLNFDVISLCYCNGHL